MTCVLNKECWMCNVCELLGECVYGHHLITDPKQLHNRLVQMPQTKRAKHILHVFQGLQPPKVSNQRIFHEFKNSILVKHGIEPIPFKEKQKKEKYVPKIKWDQKMYDAKLNQVALDISAFNTENNKIDTGMQKLKQKKLSNNIKISKKMLYQKLLLKEMRENCPQENFHEPITHETHEPMR